MKEKGRNLPASVQQRLRNRVLRTGEDLQYVLMRYAVERFLYRFSRSDFADEVVVKANLPGLTTDDVQITVTSDLLTLRGELKPVTAQKEATYHIMERRSGIFERSVTLPTDVQTEKARADFENGVLTITLPKAEAVKPKSITIKAK